MQAELNLFDGKNFPNWSFRMETLLEKRQLVDCIRRDADEIPEFQMAEERSRRGSEGDKTGGA